MPQRRLPSISITSEDVAAEKGLSITAGCRAALPAASGPYAAASNLLLAPFVRWYPGGSWMRRRSVLLAAVMGASAETNVAPRGTGGPSSSLVESEGAAASGDTRGGGTPDSSSVRSVPLLGSNTLHGWSMLFKALLDMQPCTAVSLASVGS